MGQGSLSGTLWSAFLLVNSSVRVRGVEVKEMEHCESASFILESNESMRMNLSTCFTQISWDKVCYDKKKEREKVSSNKCKSGGASEGEETNRIEQVGIGNLE